MTQSTSRPLCWWHTRYWLWGALGGALILGSIAAQLDHLRDRELYPQWVALHAAAAAQQLRDIVEPLWPMHAWERWTLVPGVRGVVIRRNDTIIWSAQQTDAALPQCPESLAAVTTACRWHQAVRDAQGTMLATISWDLDPSGWRGGAVGTWWGGAAVFALGAGLLLWIQLRRPYGVAAVSQVTDSPPTLVAERQPTSMDWALGAADVVTQPVLVLDAQYRVVNANGSAHGAYPVLRTLLGQHWYDVAERLPGSPRLLAALDSVGTAGPVSCFQPGTDAEPGIGAARLMVGDTCYGYWMALDVPR